MRFILEPGAETSQTLWVPTPGGCGADSPGRAGRGGGAVGRPVGVRLRASPAAKPRAGRRAAGRPLGACRTSPCSRRGASWCSRVSFGRVPMCARIWKGPSEWRPATRTTMPSRYISTGSRPSAARPRPSRPPCRRHQRQSLGSEERPCQGNAIHHAHPRRHRTRRSAGRPALVPRRSRLTRTGGHRPLSPACAPPCVWRNGRASTAHGSSVPPPPPAAPPTITPCPGEPHEKGAPWTASPRPLSPPSPPC